MSGSLRVHGGAAGGRRLHSPKNIRPTQGVVKEAIFNALGDTVTGARVLDLFAGSGALGIEALSRGAASAAFVDSDPDAAQVVQRNLAALGYTDRASVQRGHVAGWIGSHREVVGEATVILLDPPYNDPVLYQAVALLDGLVGEGAAVVLESSSRQRPPETQRLRVTWKRRYGDTVVTFLTA